MAANDLNGVRQRLGRKLMIISRKRFQLGDILLEKIGLGHGQVPVLMDLNRFGELGQNTLAEKAHITPATMSGTLKRMERDGVIKRRSDENDARVSLVSLTDKGKELAEKARELFLLMDEQMFANVPEEECERILGMMETVQENLEKAIQGGTHEKTV
ncbi:MAG: MarR family transcriptional regulator [Clostridiales bacterium]|nr:MarR family transcriptional regulator [Clostridiales bacterium]